MSSAGTVDAILGRRPPPPRRQFATRTYDRMRRLQLLIIPKLLINTSRRMQSVRTTDDDFFFSLGDRYNFFGCTTHTHTYTAARQSFSGHNDNNILYNIIILYTGTQQLNANTHMPAHTRSHVVVPRILHTRRAK